MLGTVDGVLVGSTLGVDDGFADGTVDGTSDGNTLGVVEGTDDGAELRDGALLGIFDGHALIIRIASN